MLPSCPSFLTVSKYGNGFQVPGVVLFCFTGAHVTAWAFSQSGSDPGTT